MKSSTFGCVPLLSVIRDHVTPALDKISLPIRLDDVSISVSQQHNVSMILSVDGYTNARLSVYDNDRTFEDVMEAIRHPYQFAEPHNLGRQILGIDLQGRLPQEQVVDLNAHIHKYLDASSGFTSDLSDNFQRMIYFSATTITTLGYGDIIPLTTPARNLVTMEAIAGVVLIGLFLNSLTRRRTDQ
jgi:hypothetical protein